jgi:type IV pilus assembly protein PilB
MGRRLKLGEMLLAKGLISETQLAAALGEQRRWGKRLGMTLVLMGLLEEETLVRTLAAQLHLPVARIRGKCVNREVIELVPVELAEKHRCLPLFVKEQGGSRELFLAMEDPSDLEAQGELGFRIGFRIRPVLIAPTELEDALQRHYHWASLAGAAGPELAAPAAPSRGASVAPLPERMLEPYEDTEPEMPRAAAASETPAEAPPAAAGIERAAAELGAIGAQTSPPAAPAERAERDAPAAAPPSVSADVILRALSQLLVEKGVISREELVERLRVIAARQGEGRRAS